MVGTERENGGVGREFVVWRWFGSECGRGRVLGRLRDLRGEKAAQAIDDGIEQAQQQQQAQLVVVQLTVAGPVPSATRVAQTFQQRRQLLEVLQAGHVRGRYVGFWATATTSRGRHLATCSDVIRRLDLPEIPSPTAG